MHKALERLLDHVEMFGWLAAFRVASVGLDARSLLRIPTRWSGALPARAPAPTHEQGDPSGRSLARAARTLHRARRLVPRTLCMHRALAARMWLARRGISSTVVLGVRGEPSGLTGHAWLEFAPPTESPRATYAERDLFDRSNHRVVLREDDPRVQRP